MPQLQFVRWQIISNSAEKKSRFRRLAYVLKKLENDVVKVEEGSVGGSWCVIRAHHGGNTSFYKHIPAMRLHD